MQPINAISHTEGAGGPAGACGSGEGVRRVDARVSEEGVREVGAGVPEEGVRGVDAGVPEEEVRGVGGVAWSLPTIPIVVSEYPGFAVNIRRSHLSDAEESLSSGFNGR